MPVVGYEIAATTMCWVSFRAGSDHLTFFDDVLRHRC